MDEAILVKQICDSFAGVDVLEASASYYFYYEPDKSVEPDRRFPFATLVTNDDHDQASDLSRPGVFRLNVGISKQSFRDLFAPSAQTGNSGEVTYDYAALDQLMPHPVYGSLYWVCVLNPGPKTSETVQRLLSEAYETAVKKRSMAVPAHEA